MALSAELQVDQRGVTRDTCSSVLALQQLVIEHLKLPVLLPEHGHVVLEEYGVHSHRRVNERDVPICVSDHVEASYPVLVLFLLECGRVSSSSRQCLLLCDLDGGLMGNVGHHEVEYDIQTVGILYR